MTFRQTAKRFFEPVRTNPIMWLKATWQYFLFSVWPIITILFLKQITTTIEQWDQEAFMINIIRFSIIIWCYYICRIIFKDRWRVAIFWKWEKDIYKKYIPWFVSLDNTSIEQIGTWRMISIVQQWFTTWITLLSTIFRKGMDLILWLGLVLYVLYTTTSHLIIIFLIALFIVQYIIYRLNILILQNKRLWNPLRNEYTRFLVRILMSKFEIMQQDKAHKEVIKLDRNRDEFYELTKKRSLHIEWNYLIPNILIFWLYIALFLIIGDGIFDGTYTFADLVLFTSTLGLLDWTLDTLSTAIKDFFQDYSQVEQLRETFDNTPQTDYNNGLPFNYTQWDIHLNDITFYYGETAVFEKFSLTLQWWTKTAFVWESGWGKTTLIKLLAWYLRPDSGEIVIDGQKLSEIKLTDYYRHIGYLTQDPSVFDGTIWENLVYGIPEDFDQKMSENKKKSSQSSAISSVISLAKCEFIYEFEHWLQTEIGERWVRLSWGQKQRLAIAKIMLKNPDIILLDEPTSALDSFNEELVSEALTNLFKWKTVIVVAHRLQTVKNADRILYIEQIPPTPLSQGGARIVEDGTHTSLIKKNGKYKKMLDLQSGF